MIRACRTAPRGWSFSASASGRGPTASTRSSRSRATNGAAAGARASGSTGSRSRSSLDAPSARSSTTWGRTLRRRWPFSTTRSISRSASRRRWTRGRSTCATSAGARSACSRRPLRRPSRNSFSSPHVAGRRLTREFFARSVHEVAPELIGVTLLVEGVGGRIVEVEAYDQDDAASQGFRGRTARTASMFGPPGHAYVYRSYGIHWCLNLVCAEAGRSEAALVRALEPTSGLDAMRERRGLEGERALCSGPGKLCQALGITRVLDGRALDEPPFQLLAREAEPPLAVGPRIGITRAVEQPWRYGLAGSPFLSRRF